MRSTMRPNLTAHSVEELRHQWQLALARPKTLSVRQQLADIELELIKRSWEASA